MAGKKVNKAELALIFGVSMRSLTEWQGRGMPIEVDASRGKSNSYDTAECIAWRGQDLIRQLIGDEVPAGELLDLEQERAQLARVQRVRIEVQLEREGPLFVRTDEVLETWINTVASARSVLLNLPSKCAVPLAFASTAPECESIVRSAVYEALDTLAEGDGTPKQRQVKGETA